MFMSMVEIHSARVPRVGSLCWSVQDKQVSAAAGARVLTLSTNPAWLVLLILEWARPWEGGFAFVLTTSYFQLYLATDFESISLRRLQERLGCLHPSAQSKQDSSHLIPQGTKVRAFRHSQAYQLLEL